MMKSLTRLAALLSLLRLVYAQSDDIRIGLPPSVRVAYTNFYGVGCPDATRGHVEVNEQNQIFIQTIYLDARKGTDIPADQAIHDCTAEIKFRYNKGEQFAVYSEKIKGMIVLKRGMEAIQDTSITYGSYGQLTNAGTDHYKRTWPKQQSDIATSSHPLLNTDFTQDITDTKNIPWSSCNGDEHLTIKVNAEVIGNAGYTGGYTGMPASLEVSETQFSMMWRKCSEVKPVPKPKSAPPPPATPTFESAGVGFGQGQTNPFSGAINGDPEGPPPPPLGWTAGVSEAPSATPRPSSWETIENGLLTWPTRRPMRTTKPTKPTGA